MISTIVIGAGRYPENAPEIQLRGGIEDSLTPSLVLEHSIRTYWPQANIINTYEMKKVRMQRMKNPTPFSMVRFMVPALCGFKGWAVYCDADQIFFADPRTMWNVVERDPGKTAYVGVVGGCTGVILMNCAELKGWDAEQIARRIDSGTVNYGTIMTQLNGLGFGRIGALGRQWNSPDTYVEGETKLLHFTNLSTQPWKFPGEHPLECFWADALRDAVNAGVVLEGQLDENCSKIFRSGKPIRMGG